LKTKLFDAFELSVDLERKGAEVDYLIVYLVNEKKLSEVL